MQWVLVTCANHARALLILGLLAGVGLPGLAAAMAPYLPQMVAVLLVITAFRIGRRAAFGALKDLRWSLPAVIVLQVGLPLILAAGLWITGALHAPLGLALILAASAPTISGGASLAVILGQNPARVMQLLVLGTALFPATVFAVLHIVPVLADTSTLAAVGGRSLATIAAATALGFLLRWALLPDPSDLQVKAMDGAAVLFFAIIVIGLMAALGPMLQTAPIAVLWWMVAAFGLSFGVQTLAILLLSRSPLAHVAGPLALAAGNRNIALFLVALPPEVIAPIMIFIACWQLPMYLTPILLRGLYNRTLPNDA